MRHRSQRRRVQREHKTFLLSFGDFPFEVSSLKYMAASSGGLQKGHCRPPWTNQMQSSIKFGSFDPHDINQSLSFFHFFLSSVPLFPLVPPDKECERCRQFGVLLKNSSWKLGFLTDKSSGQKDGLCQFVGQEMTIGFCPSLDLLIV